MKRIAIVDYNMGNVASVRKAFEHLGAKILLTAKKAEIENADAIVLPGVGAFADGMRNLTALGLISILKQEVIIKQKPFLGICLGMQLLADKGYEFSECAGLGFIGGEIVKLHPSNNLRLPHVGWDDVEFADDDSFFDGVADKNFYFLHSYHFQCTETTLTIATCTYGEKFIAAFHKNNIYATQFHPEKSQISGLQVLKNFLATVV